MTIFRNTNKQAKWLPYLAATALLASFFLPWVSWQGIVINGFDLPAGRFFNVSGNEFGLENPLPALSFTFYLFWLIPIGSLLCIFLTARNRKSSLVFFITGATSLALVSLFYFFTGKLVMLGVGQNAIAMLKPAIALQAIAAIALILSQQTSYAVLKKIGWILVGPVFVFLSFQLMEKYMLSRTYDDTSDVKADYTINANALLSEFLANDSAANNKYREKIVSVNGNASEVNIQSDSTVIVKFADSTGSYIIFSLDKEQYPKASVLKAGEPVSLKGACSGSVFSEILGTTSISFKRVIINKQ